MEPRVSRLEAQYEHLRDDLKRVEGKVDQLDKKIDSKVGMLEARMEKIELRLDKLEIQFAVFIEKLKTSRMYDRVWQLIVNAAMLGVMARGFKWI